METASIDIIGTEHKSNKCNTKPTQAQRKRTIIESLRKGNFVTAALLQADISNVTHYRWLKQDANYAEAVAQAKRLRIYVLENRAFALAKEGNTDLIKFLLRAWDPAYSPERESAPIVLQTNNGILSEEEQQVVKKIVESFKRYQSEEERKILERRLIT
jgi:hypothetical protein